MEIDNADELKGRAKEAAGDLTDNEDLQREGKGDQVEGNVKGKIDAAGDKAEGVVDKLRDKF